MKNKTQANFGAWFDLGCLMTKVYRQTVKTHTMWRLILGPNSIDNGIDKVEIDISPPPLSLVTDVGSQTRATIINTSVKLNIF